jgi:hypothetical protein
MADARIWDGSKWISIMGPQGPQGEPGKDGSGVTIQGTATTWPPAASPAQGDMYLLGDPVPAGAPAGSQPGDGVVWTGTAWQNVGSIRGPKGDKGDAGTDGSPGVDGAPGAPGADGTGFTFRGEFDAGAEYDNNDVVTFGGETYLVTGLTRASLIGPGDLVLLAKKGVDGTIGADGADGKSIEVYVQATQPAAASKGDIWIDNTP